MSLLGELTIYLLDKSIQLGTRYVRATLAQQRRLRETWQEMRERHRQEDALWEAQRALNRRDGL